MARGTLKLAYYPWEGAPESKSDLALIAKDFSDDLDNKLGVTRLSPRCTTVPSEIGHVIDDLIADLQEIRKQVNKGYPWKGAVKL